MREFVLFMGMFLVAAVFALRMSDASAQDEMASGEILGSAYYEYGAPTGMAIGVVETGLAMTAAPCNACVHAQRQDCCYEQGCARCQPHWTDDLWAGYCDQKAQKQANWKHAFTGDWRPTIPVPARPGCRACRGGAIVSGASCGCSGSACKGCSG